MKEKLGLVIVLLLMSSSTMIYSYRQASAEAGESAGPAGHTIWESEVAFEGTDPIDGVAVGEVYTDLPGQETVITSRDGGVYLVYRDQGRWVKERIWDSPGQQLTPAVGDLRPDREGNEILVVGLSSGTEDDDPGDGTATVLYREGGSWRFERAFTDTKLIHGCAVGDLDPSHPGIEAVLTTFNYTAVVLWWDGSEYRNELLFTDSHNVRKAVIADIAPYHDGNEVVCVSKSGNVTLSYGTAGNWTSETIYSGLPLARVAVGDVDPDPGLEIYAGADTMNGEVVGIKWSGSRWVDTVVFEDVNKNRGVWAGDVDPDIPGQELYTFGYSRRLVQVIDPFGTGRGSREIFRDTARGHEIRIGDMDPASDGNEIALVGYSNNLTVVSIKEEGSSLTPSIRYTSRATVGSGEETSLDLEIDGGDTYMELEVVSPDGIEASVYPEMLFIMGTARLTILAEPTREDAVKDVTIVLNYPGGNTTVVIALSVTGDDSPPVPVSISDRSGNALNNGSTVPWNGTILVEFSEPVTRDSFESALESGAIRLDWGDEARDVEITLSGDGTEIMIALDEQVPVGGVKLTISGLRDEAGNEMGALTMDLNIKGEEENGPGSLWFIILVVFLIIVVVVAIMLYFFLVRKGEDDMDEETLPDLPKNI